MVSEQEATSQRLVTLGDALREFLQTLKPQQRSNFEGFVRKYVDFVGDDQPVSMLSGARVESYALAQIRAADPSAPDRVAALKAWFQYLKKKEYTTANYGVNVRLPRSPMRAALMAPRPQETPVEMTAEGLESLKVEFEGLEAQRAQLIQAIETARQDGDLRENAPYHAAREALAFHSNRMRQVEESLRRAVVVETAADHDEATVGTTVAVTNLDDEQQAHYTLVSAREANGAERKISVDSPVGRQLLGRRIGDEVQVTTPRGEIRLRVDAISR